MKNYFLDPLTNDLVLDSTNNLRFTTTLTEFVSQKIINALQTFAGEWFLDIDEGLPFYNRILIKNADLDDVDNLLQSEILSIPEVVEIIDYNADFDNTGRKYVVDFTVKAEEQTELIPGTATI